MRYAFLILLAVGCRHDDPSRQFAAGITPPEPLAKVHVGMTLGEVELVAPQVSCPHGSNDCLLAPARDGVRLVAKTDRRGVVEDVYATWDAYKFDSIVKIWGHASAESRSDDVWRGSLGWSARGNCYVGSCWLRFTPYRSANELFVTLAPPGLEHLSIGATRADVVAVTGDSSFTERVQTKHFAPFGLTRQIYLADDDRVEAIGYRRDPDFVAPSIAPDVWPLTSWTTRYVDAKTGWAVFASAESLLFARYEPFAQQLSVLEELARSHDVASAVREHPDLRWEHVDDSLAALCVPVTELDMTTGVCQRGVHVRVIDRQLVVTRELVLDAPDAFSEMLERRWGAAPTGDDDDERIWPGHGRLVRHSSTYVLVLESARSTAARRR